MIVTLVIWTLPTIAILTIMYGEITAMLTVRVSHRINIEERTEELSEPDNGE